MHKKQGVISCAILLMFGIVLLSFEVNFVCASDSNEEQVHKMPAINPPASFDPLKKLVGSWKGTQDSPEGKKEVAVEYYLTSAGTALVEKTGPGSEYEMLSVYHGQGDNVVMTHYCAFGNQPKMAMVKSDDSNTIRFSYIDSGTANDAHMHQLTLKWVSADHLTQEWVFHQNGKPAHTAKFDLHRKM